MCFSASPPYYYSTLLQNFLEEEENFVTLFLQYLFFIAFQYYPRAGRFLSAKQRAESVATFRYMLLLLKLGPISYAQIIKYIFKVYGHLLFECNEKDDGTGSELLRERRREVRIELHIEFHFFALDLPWGDL